MGDHAFTSPRRRGGDVVPRDRDFVVGGVVRMQAERKLSLSTAGVARVRGHDALRRNDLLDGIAAALVKESLDTPLPWSQRGVVRR
ncbi:MAG: hypothetical protein MUF54_23245 [Polyangiaceae bacterium]|nr:hypothetical protein [Polyangiaceae bacterium]